MTPRHGNGTWMKAALSALGALLLLMLTLRVQELSAARRDLIDRVTALEQRVTLLEAKR